MIFYVRWGFFFFGSGYDGTEKLNDFCDFMRMDNVEDTRFLPF